MIEVGAIRKSRSPWVSAVVLVRKKDGSLRFCIDLQKLNACTIKDAYSLPHIEWCDHFHISRFEEWLLVG